ASTARAERTWWLTALGSCREKWVQGCDLTMSQRARAALLIVGLTASFFPVTASGTKTPAPNGAGTATTAPARLHLTAKQIVANNVKARGGLEAWRKIETMILSGHLVTGNQAMPVV